MKPRGLSVLVLIFLRCDVVSISSGFAFETNQVFFVRKVGTPPTLAFVVVGYPRSKISSYSLFLDFFQKTCLSLFNDIGNCRTMTLFNH